MRALPELLFGVGNGDFSKIFLAVFLSIALGSIFFLRRVIVSLNLHRPLEQQQNQNRNHQQPPRFNIREEAMDLAMLFEVAYSWVDPGDVARLTLPEFVYVAFFVFVKWKQRLLAQALNAEMDAYNTDDTMLTSIENRKLRRSGSGRSRGRGLDNDELAANAMNNAASQQCLYRSRLHLRDEPTHIPVRKRRGRDKTTAPMRARLVRARAAAKLFGKASPPVPSVFPAVDGRDEDE